MTDLNEKALATFTEYFIKNYPGPDTIIFDPKWHAPKIFRAAISAYLSALPEQEPVGHCVWITPSKLAACAKSAKGAFPVFQSPPVGYQKPIAHLVWLQGRRAVDDVEDYYEVARPGDKSVDGSEPIPVFASPVAHPLRDEEVERHRQEGIDTAARFSRLHRICQRILWTDLGVPAMENKQTKAAMSDLAELMLMDALIAASPEAAEAKLAALQPDQQANKCGGADDPEERCPRHPRDCKCWQVDFNHPTMPLQPDQAGSGDAVRVKALEWNPFRAETAFGYYSIDDQRDRPDEELKGRPPFLLSGSRLNLSRYETLEAARAAAQADYGQRIRSALSKDTEERG